MYMKNCNPLELKIKVINSLDMIKKGVVLADKT